MCSSDLLQKNMFPTDDWARCTCDQAPEDAYRPLSADECRDLAGSGLVALGSLSQSGTQTTDGSLTFDHELAKGVDSLAWRRIHVASWDTPSTLAARLTHSSASRPLHSRITASRLESEPKVDEQQLSTTSDSTIHPASNLPSTADAVGGDGVTKQRQVDISVIVPTYNRADWIGDALQSLIDQKTDDRFSFDIHVVDNASSDATAAVIAQVAAVSPIPVVYHRQELPGDAPTRNLGVARSTGPWLAFFDDDQLAEPMWPQLRRASCRERV